MKCSECGTELNTFNQADIAYHKRSSFCYEEKIGQKIKGLGMKPVPWQLRLMIERLPINYIGYRNNIYCMPSLVDKMEILFQAGFGLDRIKCLIQLKEDDEELIASIVMAKMGQI